MENIYHCRHRKFAVVTRMMLEESALHETLVPNATAKLHILQIIPKNPPQNPQEYGAETERNVGMPWVLAW